MTPWFAVKFQRKSLTTKGTKVHKGKFARGLFLSPRDRIIRLEDETSVSINLLPARITLGACGRIRGQEILGKRYVLATRKSPVLAKEARSGAPWIWMAIRLLSLKIGDFHRGQNETE
jgi:hypothetical protein